jgi:hypothetical protein
MAEESRTKVIVVDFGYPVMLFGLLTPKDWSYLAFQSYNYECARGRLFQKRILCTKVAIYIVRFICPGYNRIHTPRYSWNTAKVGVKHQSINIIASKHVYVFIL